MCYAWDGFQWYPNSLHFCLGIIFDHCGTGKLLHCRVATIKRHVQLQARTKIIAIVNQKLCKPIIPTCTHHFIYYHSIYQYCSIYHAFSILPLHLPSSFECVYYSYLWSVLMLTHGFNRKLSCILIICTKTNRCYFVYHPLVQYFL